MRRQTRALRHWRQPRTRPSPALGRGPAAGRAGAARRDARAGASRNQATARPRGDCGKREAHAAALCRVADTRHTRSDGPASRPCPLRAWCHRRTEEDAGGIRCSAWSRVEVGWFGAAGSTPTERDEFRTKLPVESGKGELGLRIANNPRDTKTGFPGVSAIRNPQPAIVYSSPGSMIAANEFLARFNRLFTVPRLQPVISAISSYDLPSSSRSTNTWR